MMDDLPEPEPKKLKYTVSQHRPKHVIGMVLSAADHPRSGTQTRSRTWPRPDPEMMTARYWGRALSSKSQISHLGPKSYFWARGGQSNQPSKMND